MVRRVMSSAVGSAILGLALLLGGVACAEDDPVEGLEQTCPEGNGSEACEVFHLVNEERAQAGLAPYVYDADLALAAQLHAVDMVDNAFFSHDSQDGRSFVDRINEASYEGAARGENIAKGQQTPDAVMNSWMNSPGHRANILSAGANEIGIGFKNAHWVQVFGSR